MAREEILITAWKLSPSLLLTRPPLPSIRLDQLLKHKADRGVKIYVLLYKEVFRAVGPLVMPVSTLMLLVCQCLLHVALFLFIALRQVELSGTGNESYNCRLKLSSLSDTGNIRVIRHPNKLFGGSTAVLWSHHEKLAIVDRLADLSIMSKRVI